MAHRFYAGLNDAWDLDRVRKIHALWLRGVPAVGAGAP